MPMARKVAVAGVCLAAATGCYGLDNAGLRRAAPGSPAPDEMSSEAPVYSERDNPQLAGAFNWQSGQSSRASGSFGSDGEWAGVAGYLTVDEWQHDGGRFGEIQYLRMLPRPGEFSGPGVAVWNTQGANLVVGNTLEIGVAHGSLPTALTTSPKPLWVKLAPTVLLVPVLVLSWFFPRTPGDADREVELARARFDFEPLRSSASELSVVPSPDHSQTPPDDVFAQCGIQFQLVGAYREDFDTPGAQVACGNSGCLISSEPLDLDQEATIERLRTDGKIDEAGRTALLRLSPLQVHYGRFDCSAWWGKACNGIANVDNDFGVPRRTTAHELGHLLIGPGHTADPSNLMASSGAGTSLTPAQCATARTAATSLAARFARLHLEGGRVHPPFYDSHQFPVSASAVCCLRDGIPRWEGEAFCRWSLGSRLPAEYCVPDPEVCCVSASGLSVDALEVPLSSCSGEVFNTPAPCTQACCLVDGVETNQYTYYRCGQLGGVPCPTIPG